MSLNLGIEQTMQHVIFGWTFDTYSNLAAGIPTTWQRGVGTPLFFALNSATLTGRFRRGQSQLAGTTPS